MLRSEVQLLKQHLGLQSKVKDVADSIMSRLGSLSDMKEKNAPLSGRQPSHRTNQTTQAGLAREGSFSKYLFMPVQKENHPPKMTFGNKESCVQSDSDHDET